MARIGITKSTSCNNQIGFFHSKGTLAKQTHKIFRSTETTKQSLEGGHDQQKISMARHVSAINFYFHKNEAIFLNFVNNFIFDDVLVCYLFLVYITTDEYFENTPGFNILLGT